MITIITENNIIDISVIETTVNVNSIKSNVVQVTTDNNIIDVSVEKQNITVNPVGEIIVQAFPAGLKGDIGLQGEQGIKGDKGEKGDTGSQGIQGIQGEKGDTGDAPIIQEIEDISGEIPLGTHFIYKKTTDFKNCMMSFLGFPVAYNYSSKGTPQFFDAYQTTGGLKISTELQNV